MRGISVYRYLIGSILFHIVIIGWADLCLPAFKDSFSQKPQVIFQVEYENEAENNLFKNENNDRAKNLLLKQIRDYPQPESFKKGAFEPTGQKSMNDAIQYEKEKVNSNSDFVNGDKEKPPSNQVYPITDSSVQTSDPKEIRQIKETVITPKLETDNTGTQQLKLIQKPITEASIPVEKRGSDLPAVDIPPQKIYHPAPQYPFKAKRNNWEGTVWLLVEILDNGKVGQVIVVGSSQHDVLDQAAVTIIKQWRFKPALTDGKPVRCQMEIPIKFQLES